MKGFAAALALGLAVACGGEAESPEARVRAALDGVEVAAEAKDLRALKDAVSDAYGDPHGNDKREVERLLTYHFFRNRSIHLLSRVGEVGFPQPGRAEATAFVAMAGRPIPDAAALAGLSADLYRFEFTLADEDGTWRVVAADWRPANREDFLP